MTADELAQVIVAVEGTDPPAPDAARLFRGLLRMVIALRALQERARAMPTPDFTREAFSAERSVDEWVEDAIRREGGAP